eukprot:gene9102-230_t
MVLAMPQCEQRRPEQLTGVARIRVPPRRGHGTEYVTAADIPTPSSSSVRVDIASPPPSENGGLCIALVYPCCPGLGLCLLDPLKPSASSPNTSNTAHLPSKCWEHRVPAEEAAGTWVRRGGTHAAWVRNMAQADRPKLYGAGGAKGGADLWSRRDLYRWVGGGSCPPAVDRLTVKDFAGTLGARTLAFVGDSLAGQQFMDLVDMLAQSRQPHAHLPALVPGAMPVSEQQALPCPPEALSPRSAACLRLADAHHASLFGHKLGMRRWRARTPAGGLIVFVNANWLVHPHKPDAAEAKAAEPGGARDYLLDCVLGADVVLVSASAWYSEARLSGGVAKDVTEKLSDKQLLSLYNTSASTLAIWASAAAVRAAAVRPKGPPPLFVVRSSLPAHSGCQRFHHPPLELSKAQVLETTAPDAKERRQYAWHLLPAYDEAWGAGTPAATSMPVGWLWLGARDMLLGRPEQHNGVPITWPKYAIMFVVVLLPACAFNDSLGEVYAPGQEVTRTGASACPGRILSLRRCMPLHPCAAAAGPGGVVMLVTCHADPSDTYLCCAVLFSRHDSMDCLHWRIPGVLESVNNALFTMLRSHGPLPPPACRGYALSSTATSEPSCQSAN